MRERRTQQRGATAPASEAAEAAIEDQEKWGSLGRVRHRSDEQRDADAVGIHGIQLRPHERDGRGAHRACSKARNKACTEGSDMGVPRRLLLHQDVRAVPAERAADGAGTVSPLRRREEAWCVDVGVRRRRHVQRVDLRVRGRGRRGEPVPAARTRTGPPHAPPRHPSRDHERLQNR